MRAAVFAAFAVTACTPQIESGTYFCGPNRLCPDGMECNGGDDGDEETFDNVCVLAGNAEPFGCATADPPADNDPASGTLVGELGCVSGVHEARGCLTAADPGDWYQFDVPDNCVAVQIEARMVFPVAFEPLALQIASDGGGPAVAQTPCTNAADPEAGDTQRCFVLTVTPGSHHALGVVHTGVENCGGGCANNRYTLSFELSTP